MFAFLCIGVLQTPSRGAYVVCEIENIVIKTNKQTSIAIIFKNYPGHGVFQAVQEAVTSEEVIYW